MPENSRPVRIVTDSAADIPADLAQELGITVVPLLVHLGGRSFRDGVNLSGADFYRELEATRSVTTTSLPTLQSFEDAYRTLTNSGYDVVSIHMSSKLSGTFNAALMASTGDGVEDDAISVIDSLTLSMSQGWIAIRCAQAARDDGSRGEIEALAQELVGKARLFGVLDTLEYVIKSGRVGRVPGTVGAMLNIKPILTVRPSGEAAILERVRIRKKALQRIVELTAQAGELDALAVMHGDEEEGAQELLSMLEGLNPPQPVVVGHIGAVLGTHVGPGAVGVCFLVK